MDVLLFVFNSSNTMAFLYIADCSDPLFVRLQAQCFISEYILKCRTVWERAPENLNLQFESHRTFCNDISRIIFIHVPCSGITQISRSLEPM